MTDIVLWGLLRTAARGFWRVVVGPTIPDRIVAADTLSTLLTTFIVLLGLRFRNAVFLDVALAFAVLSFADVLIMAKYFEHGELHR